MNTSYSPFNDGFQIDSRLLLRDLTRKPLRSGALFHWGKDGEGGTIQPGLFSEEE